jgi:heme-degrading monooxygenase HmoA
MIARIWHGWTTEANAGKYELLLREEIFVGIRERHIPGFRSIRLLRRDAVGEVEFVTLMEFDSLDAVRKFAGKDYEKAVVPDAARALLSRFDERSQHYEVRLEHEAKDNHGAGVSGRS